MSHIKKFHKFDSPGSDDKESDSDINVVYDADEKPSCVKAFKEEINQNICRLCNLKFLTRRMLKSHNAKHHPQEKTKQKKSRQSSCQK